MSFYNGYSRAQDPKSHASTQMELENTSGQAAAEFRPPHFRDGHGRYVQCQSQAQRLRTLQASEQKLYDVYEHTVGMIEELEKHEEHGKSAGNSGLLSHIIPMETKKPIHEVFAKIEAELTCFDAQMKFAQPEAKKKAKEKMLQKTLMWWAAREEKDIPLGEVDLYAWNVFQILREEPMKLPKTEKDPTTELDGHTVNDLLYKYAQARHQGDQQDKQFHENPNKKPAIRQMRKGQDELNGVKRLEKLDRYDML